MASKEANLAILLSTLETTAAKIDDTLEAYETFVSNLKENELSLFNEDVVKNYKKVVTILRRDIKSESDPVVQGALQVLGFCLHDLDIARNLSVSEIKFIIGELVDCTQKSEDKTTCTRALWCLSRQNFQPHYLKDQLSSILDGLSCAVEKWKGQSNTVEFEALNTLSRLQEQCLRDLEPLSCQLANLVYPLLTHSAVKIREKSLEVLQAGLKPLIVFQTPEFIKEFMTALKSKIIGELTKLFQTKNEVYVLSVWSIIVQILGKELHHGGFINHILPLAEMAFKNSSPLIKCTAFDAWQQLIDNFALNPAIVSDAKRVKLIMQVFKINNAKVETVAEKKLSVWWHFIRCLGAKATTYFDQVCVPLLQMCVGATKVTGQTTQSLSTPTFCRVALVNVGSSPITPRLNLSNDGAKFLTFPSIQLKGFEIISQILGKIPDDIGIPQVQYTIEPLKCEIMTGPSFFIKQSSTIIACVKELLMAQGKNITDGLLYHIWYGLVAHIKNVLESGAKSESREVLTSFLTFFQIIVITDVLDNSHLLKLFQAVCCLPRKALCSTAYQLGGGEVLHGTPVLFLTELLLTPKLMEACAISEKYMSLFGLLIEIGVSHGSVLEFSQLILQVLDRHKEFVDSDQLWRMWSIVIHPLQDHIIKTSEVNQGDVLEPDFTCMYLALMFPIETLLPGRLAQGTMKTLLKTWSELYSTFSRLSSMVTNAEANVCCEQLCQKILSNVDFEHVQDFSYLDTLSQMLEVILGQVDFSSLGAPRVFTATLSPSRWIKRKQRPLENIHSFISVLEKTLTAFYELSSLNKTPSKSKNVSSTQLQSTCSCLVGVLTTLFTHITSSQIISSLIDDLAKAIGEMYQSPVVKAFSASFQVKLEKLWLDISTCLQSRYTGGFDSDFLAQLSPLLEATFNHSRRQIKNQTVLLWNATFSKSPPLKYPDTLRAVLMRVKEKSPIMLPGWISTDLPILEETPVSQFSQAGSQAPVPQLPGMPSPHKIRGSFLNKAISPNIKKSPAKAIGSKTDVSSPVVGKVKKNLSLSDMKDEDFVVIAPSPKHKILLTDHQKEVLRERSTLPAMYNNLELSQDVSLSSQFITDTQPEMSQQPEDSVIILDSQSQIMKPPSEPPAKTKTSDDAPPAKRRRSIRFSDEVFKKDSGKDETITIANGNSVKDQIEEISKEKESDKSIPDSEDEKDAQNSNFFGLGNKSSHSKDTEDSCKLSESSTRPSTRNSSMSELFSCTDDSMSAITANINVDSLVEETQDVFSPPKPGLEPADPETVMETPVKSMEESVALTGTPASRALFSTENSQVKSPVIKIQRLSGEEIEKYSPHRGRHSEDDVIVSSQKESKLPTNNIKVRRSLSHPESGKFGGELLGSAKDVALNPARNTQKDGMSEEIVPESPEQLSQGFSPTILESDNKSSNQGNKLTGIVEEVNEDMENSDVVVTESQPSCIFAQAQSTPACSVFTPNLAMSTLKQSGELFSELTPIPEVMSDEEDSIESSSKISTRSSQGQKEDSVTSDNSYDPDLKSTLASPAETRSRRKSQTPLKFQKSAVDLRGRRKSLPAKMESKDTGMRTRLSESSQSQDGSQSSRRDTRSSKAQNDKNTRKARRSCLGAIENTATSKSTANSSKNKLKDSQERLSSKLEKSSDTPGRGRKRGRKSDDLEENERDVQQDVQVGFVLVSNDSEISFKASPLDKTKLSEGLKNDLLQVTQDKTPDAREIVQKEPHRQSTSKVRRELSKGVSSNTRPPKARKSLTSVDPFSSDSEENTPLSSLASQVSKQTTDSQDPSGNSNDLSDPKSSRENDEENIADDKAVTVSDESTSIVSCPEKALTSTDKDVGTEKESDVKKIPNAEEAQDLDTDVSGTPTRQGPPKYKVAKTSPMTKRLRSAQKTPLLSSDQIDSPKSATKGKRLSLTRKRLDVGSTSENKSATKPNEEVNDKNTSAETPVNPDLETEKPNTPEGETKTGSDQNEIVPIKKGKDEVDNVKENVPLEVCKELETVSNTTNTIVEKSNKNKFTEIKDPEKKSRVRFADELDSAEGDSKNLLTTPESQTVTTLVANSDSKLHGPKRLSYPLAEREMCKTSPRGILKRTSAFKPTGGLFPRSRSYYNPWSPRGLHIKKIHPVSVPRKFSPSASPSASILKRRRLSGDVATNSPSPPSKQRRVSFADPVSAAEDVTGDQSALLQWQNCVTTPGSPSTSQIKKGGLGSQSQSSCPSTQESQLNCTEPVYPQLQQCDRPVQALLPQLTSSIWSRGLEQLVRARNIRTVGDLCNLSEYEVHNLPIRSPKVPTLRKVLRQFESRSEKKSGGSSGISNETSTSFITQKSTNEETLQDIQTPPGSPFKSGPITQSVTQSKSATDVSSDTIGQTSVANVTKPCETKEMKSCNLIGSKPVSIAAESVNDDLEDEILPAVEDALSEMSPIKKVEDVNISIDDSDDDMLSKQSNTKKTPDFLDTIRLYSEEFSSDKMQQFSAVEILNLHQNLTKLLNSAVTALGPKCRTGNTQD